MYQALIAPVQDILPHPNADRLEIVVVANNHVVVGIGNYEQDDLVIFFETDGCLSQQYCEANDLYEKFEEINGVRQRVGTGYLDANGRVKALNLRSYKSNGLVMPLSSLDFLQFDRSVLKAGFSFSSLGGVEICRKYETPATRLAREAGQPKTRKSKTKTVFHEHVETQNFRKNVQAIPIGATITITEKINGTSGRCGYVYTEQKQYNPFISMVFKHLNVRTPWRSINKAWNWLRRTIKEKGKVVTKGYAYQHGTRRALLKRDTDDAGYYAFRWVIADRLLPMLRKGEEIYYEIVGEKTSGSKIQLNHKTAVTGDNKFIKQWGAKVSYNYSVPANTAKAFVYRICITNEDGYQWDLTWDAVKARCAELGVDHVPEIWVYPSFNSSHEDLIEDVESFSLTSTFPNQFPEGVVVRVDHEGKTWFLKEKNWYFLAMEGFMKDKPDYVDTEGVEA